MGILKKTRGVMMPCVQDCPDREIGCHGRCEKYQAYRAEMDKRMQHDTQEMTARRGWIDEREWEHRKRRAWDARQRRKGK